MTDDEVAEALVNESSTAWASLLTSLHRCRTQSTTDPVTAATEGATDMATKKAAKKAAKKATSKRTRKPAAERKLRAPKVTKVSKAKFSALPAVGELQLAPNGVRASTKSRALEIEFTNGFIAKVLPIGVADGKPREDLRALLVSWLTKQLGD